MKEQTLKKILRILPFGIVLALLIAVFFLMFELKRGDEPKGTTPPTGTTAAEAPTDTVTTTSIPVTAPEEKDWALRLVNSTHPLPKDFSVAVNTFRGNHHFDKRAFPYLQEMMDAARKEGLSPLICASYRTQQQQQELFDNKVSRIEATGTPHDKAVEEAKGWVAYPGASEHQVGLAVDIVSKDYQLLEQSQANTPEAKWLKANCWKYGFILRYTPEKVAITGVGSEPWHFRYVGKEAAEKIMKQGICLEEYLGKTN